MEKNLKKALIVAIVCFLTFVLCSMIFAKINIPEVEISEGTDTVSGWGRIADYTKAGIVATGALVAGVILYITPMCILFFAMIAQLISVIVQLGNEAGWKNVTSKVFICISIVLTAVACLIMLFGLLVGMSIGKIPFLIGIVLNIYAIVVYSKEFASFNKKTTEIIESK